MERLSPRINCIFFFNDTATTEIYTLSLHDALPILDIAVGAAHIHAVLCQCGGGKNGPYGHQLLDARNHVVIEKVEEGRFVVDRKSTRLNSSHSQISYAVFCLKKTRISAHREC